MKESSTRIGHVINFIDFILVASNTATQVWKVKKEKKKFLENLKKKANEFNIQNFLFYVEYGCSHISGSLSRMLINLILAKEDF